MGHFCLTHLKEPLKCVSLQSVADAIGIQMCQRMQLLDFGLLRRFSPYHHNYGANVHNVFILKIFLAIFGALVVVSLFKSNQ